MRFPDSRILVFAKAPIKGQVKTRLSPKYSADFALKLHTNMVSHCIDLVTKSNLCPIQLWCAPSPHVKYFQNCKNDYGVELYSQHGRDLGERMSNAVNTALSKCKNVVLIGTDCPSLTQNDLREVLISLENNKDVVISPALDGGYVLMGLNRSHQQLFNDISWGSDQVFAQTKSRLRFLNWCWEETKIFWDVDRPDDIRRLQQDKSLSYLIPT